MAHLPDGGADDEFDLGRSDFGLVGRIDEMHGEIEAGSGRDSRIPIPDVEADVPIADQRGDRRGVVGVDEREVFDSVELFRQAKFCERSEA